MQQRREGEWLDQKHGIRSRRRWRKVHLAIDPGTQAIAAVDLTPDDVGDISALPDLLDRIEGPVGSVTADGATVCDEVLQRHHAARVISATLDRRSQQDRHDAAR